MVNSYLKYVVSSKESKVLFISPYGNETRKIAEKKIMDLIGEKIDNGHMLLVTSNKSAYKNIQSLYNKSYSNWVFSHFYTFEKFLHSIVLEHVDETLNLISFEVMKEFLKNQLAKSEDPFVKIRLECIINEFTYINHNQERYISNISKELPLNIYDEYLKFKIENRLLDLNDLQEEIIKLFKHKEHILKLYTNKFKYILIDDFQSYTNKEVEILKIISNESYLLCIANKREKEFLNKYILLNFTNIFDNSKKYYVNLNVNNKYSMIKFSQKCGSFNKIIKDRYLSNSYKEGDNIYTESLKNKQSVQIANDIEVAKKNGADLSDFAILYKDYKDSINILSELIKKGVKINFLDANFNIFNKFYIEDIMNLLLFVDNPNIKNFNKIYGKTTFIFTNKIVNFINKFAHNINVFKIIDSNRENLNLVDIANINKLEKVITELKNLNLQDRAKAVLNKLGYYIYIENLCRIKKIDLIKVSDFIDDFMKIISEFDSISEFYNKVISIYSIHGINLGFIDSSKGMEFKCVYVINPGEIKNEIINLNNSINIMYDEKKQKRVYYIGITRTMHKLKVLSPYVSNDKLDEDYLKFMSDKLVDFKHCKLEDESNKLLNSKLLFYHKNK